MKTSNLSSDNVKKIVDLDGSIPNPIRCQYSLNNILLPEVDHHKHLGLWLESSLSWDYHINSICAKANKVLGLIKRTFGYSNKTGIKTAFKALVIPILEYACPVWNPYLVKHTKAIEAIQRRASRLICGPDKEYPERLLELKWDSLELRRKYLSLVQMYKIIFGYCDINCHHYFDIIGITRTRSKHEYKIRPKVARTNYFKYSFFHRYINDWNSLPSEVMSSPSLQSFKVSLIKYLRS